MEKEGRRGGRLRFPPGYDHLGTFQTDRTDRRAQSCVPDNSSVLFLALGVFYEIKDSTGADLEKKLLPAQSAIKGYGDPSRSFVRSPIINWHF